MAVVSPLRSRTTLFEGRDLAESVDAAVAHWMTRTIGRRLPRETGIPRGLPYLVGFVTGCEILGGSRSRLIGISLADSCKSDRSNRS